MKRKIFFFLVFFSMVVHARPFKMYTIMLDPAGDAQKTGRSIEDSLERAITISFAQKLQEAIESYLPNSSILFTRALGETVRPFQNVNFANRMPVDLYVQINCVHMPQEKDKLYIYHYSLGDTFLTKSYALSMTPFDKAHQFNAAQTQQYAQEIAQQTGSHEYQKFFSTHGPFQLPFAPLMGIQAPAISLEISITAKDNWQKFVRPVASSIAHVLEK